MATLIKIQCDLENGDGCVHHTTTIHQEILDDTVKCPDHPDAEVIHLDIIEIEEEV